MKKVKIVISEVSIVKYKVTITEKKLKLRDVSCKPSKKKSYAIIYLKYIYFILNMCQIH